MKNSNDTIGNRTCDLPTCSAVPQPTALPRAPEKLMYSAKILSHCHWVHHKSNMVMSSTDLGLGGERPDALQIFLFEDCKTFTSIKHKNFENAENARSIVPVHG